MITISWFDLFVILTIAKIAEKFGGLLYHVIKSVYEDEDR